VILGISSKIQLFDDCIFERESCISSSTFCKNNSFISWLGHIYNESDLVYEKKWRGYSYWAPYNKKQMDSTVKLVKYLCNEFFIPIAAITHNTKVEYLEDYNGIVYKSNIGKDYTDVNPSFDFEYFIDNIFSNLDERY
jgi:hypothetical protein